jgi:hypothetical protein
MAIDKNVLKAYSVQDHEEHIGVIVFAKSNIVARRMGALQLRFCDEISGLECKRCSWADEFSTTGKVPLSIAVQHGWRFECLGCGICIDNYDESFDDDDNCIQLNPTGHMGFPFCTPECLNEYKSKQERTKTIEKERIDFLTQELLEKIPEAEITRTHAYVYWVDFKKDEYKIEQSFVEFSFPGAKYGGGKYGNNIHYATRDKYEIVMTICQGDLDAFNMLPSRSTTADNIN